MLRSRPLLRLGLLVALGAFIIDQLSKNALMYLYDLPAKGKVEILPFFDLVMVWNRGISYGLFPAESWVGQAVLIVFSLGVCAILVRWLMRTDTVLAAWAIGLVIGGAIGNVLDRLVYGAVADFVSLHAYGFYWYVFNIADAAIVVGVLLLIYDALIERKHT